jgi:hypothetical protein
MKALQFLCAFVFFCAKPAFAGEPTLIRDANGKVVAYVEKTATGTVTKDADGRLIGSTNDPAVAAATRAAEQKKADEEIRKNLSPATDARRQAKLARLQKWASQNLMLASREDQLKAALAGKMFAERRNKPLTANEFQFLNDDSKFIIILYHPQMLPPELLDAD